MKFYLKAAFLGPHDELSLISADGPPSMVILAQGEGPVEAEITSVDAPETEGMTEAGRPFDTLDLTGDDDCEPDPRD